MHNPAHFSVHLAPDALAELHVSHRAERDPSRRFVRLGGIHSEVVVCLTAAECAAAAAAWAHLAVEFAEADRDTEALTPDDLVGVDKTLCQGQVA